MVFWGQMVREVEGLLLCVFWRRGDIKLRAYCFRGSKGAAGVPELGGNGLIGFFGAE